MTMPVIFLMAGGLMSGLVTMMIHADATLSKIQQRIRVNLMIAAMTICVGGPTVAMLMFR